MYDYLIVGAGLCGSVIADQLTRKHKKVLVIDKREEVGGNVRCKKYEGCEGINVHCYGAHIFRTNQKDIWDYIQEFGEFNHFINSPIANYNGEIYNLPFNMNTFYQMFGAITPNDARCAINSDCIDIKNPQNLEEHVLSTVGKTIYKKLIKGYTEKQWHKSCKELPKEIMARIPIRFTYDNNYYNDKYQGVPVNGYNEIINNMLCQADVGVGENYNKNISKWKSMAHQVVYTGAIDELYNYEYGALEYRGLWFKHEVLHMNNYQGVAVVNYTSDNEPFTRIIEHKHFTFGDKLGYTIITKEFPKDWEKGEEPYYPIPTENNMLKYSQYKKIAEKDHYVMCGRLAEYKYYDMQDTIASAKKVAERL